jgi:hypothetical protein
MTLGYDQEENVVNLGDTAKVVAVLYDQNDQPVLADDIASVSFEIAAPDNSRTTVAGTIQSDGSGLVRFNGTTLVGPYIAIATFTLDNGDVQSVRADFEVVDPFIAASPSQSYIAAVAAWAKIEDCFDAEDDGPWLQEMTRTTFKKEKMESFLAEALFFINNANPPTTLDIGSFIMNGTPPQPTVDLPLLAQGMFLCFLRHLIRSYVEQPDVVGVQAGWHSRRDYLQRWQSVLTIEQAAFDRMLALYKRRYLGLGQTAGLVTSKAGRLISAPMRTRYIGRGYW